MSVNELSKYIFASKYARWDGDKQRRETWQECVDRIEGMMLKKYENKPEIHDDIRWAYKLMRDKRLVGSQRATQFGGDGIFKHNMRAYNCSFLYIDKLLSFQHIKYALLCGCGVGFSVQKHHIDKLPPFSSHLLNRQPTIEGITYQIQDNIESWSDSFGILLSSIFEEPVPGFEEFHHKYVEFDYSAIRPKGSKISNSNGYAPGPEPLRLAHKRIRSLLLNRIKEGYTKLRPIDAFDIVMHLADAVLAGGQRRSATIALFSKDDEEMSHAKTGNWYYENSQRARANISVALKRDEIKFNDFRQIILNAKEYGEPGIFFVNELEDGCNPCNEIGLSGHLESDYDKTGMQVCNLSEINGLKIKSDEEFYECCRAAAIIGTLQAGFDEFPYLGEISEQIIRREALLGVSISGIMDAADILLSPDIQKIGAQIVVNTNKEFAAKIGIQPGARCTTVKPSGTTSLVFGCSSGIHPRYAKRYLRRVQANPIEPIYQYFKAVNPQACKKSLNSVGDEVITFCVEVDSASRYKDDISAIELLKAVKLTKENWIEFGTNHKQLIKPHLRHNISNTISIKDDQEWEEVIKYIYENRNIFGGLTLMSSAGDRDYSDAPYVQVFTPREITNMYGDGSIFASGLITKALELWEDNLWKACDVALGIGESKSLLEEKLREIEEEFRAGEMVQSEMTLMIKKIEWLEDIQKFASKYLEGDIKKTTYLLKDVYNWKLFCDLKREYKRVDYSECIEQTDNTRPELEIACAGGACEIV